MKTLDGVAPFPDTNSTKSGVPRQIVWVANSCYPFHCTQVTTRCLSSSVSATLIACVSSSTTTTTNPACKSSHRPFPLDIGQVFLSFFPAIPAPSWLSPPFPAASSSTSPSLCIRPRVRLG